MSKFNWDRLGFIYLILGIIFIVAILNWGVNTRDKHNCYDYSIVTNQPYKFVTGRPNQCFIKTPKGWFLQNQIIQS